LPFDSGDRIAIDGDGNAYVTGSTSSNDFPITSGAFQPTYGGGAYDAFVAKIVDSPDHAAPSGTLSLSPSQLWPSNRQLVTIAPALTVFDAGGGQVTVSGPLVSSSEPETGPGDNTAPDWVVSGETLQLRAERVQGGSGRVYTVTYTLTDQAGNSAPASATVTVPKTR
jgi:hypothetical protein